MNKNLIDGYAKYCNGKWFQYPGDDDYYFRYLIHHAIQAENDQIIQAIITDFKWMNVKLQLDNTIYHLCTDIEKAIDYLTTKEVFQ